MDLPWGPQQPNVQALDFKNLVLCRKTCFSVVNTKFIHAFSSLLKFKISHSESIIYWVINCDFISADVAQQFQYAVRVIGSNFAPTVERDEFLVAEKIKKECKFRLLCLE